MIIGIMNFRADKDLSIIEPLLFELEMNGTSNHNGNIYNLYTKLGLSHDNPYQLW